MGQNHGRRREQLTMRCPFLHGGPRRVLAVHFRRHVTWRKGEACWKPLRIQDEESLLSPFLPLT